MFVQRTLAPQLQQAAREYPVVTVTGPRQAGKTTLVRAVFPHHTYVNLEQPEIRRLAQEDPQQFFHMHPGPVILDEIQRVPELLSWVQVRADETKRRGEFILTGSHQMELGQAISQSLAGRTALLTLLPFSMAELSDAGVRRDKNEWMYTGFLPRVTAEPIEPSRAYADYFRTYVERDVRQMMEIRNLTRFENFMRTLAGRAGQILNLMSLSADVGVSSTTLREWLSILEASFVVFRLPPYYRNYGKRLIKSPKIYFHETGLLCWLLTRSAARSDIRESRGHRGHESAASCGARIAFVFLAGLEPQRSGSPMGKSTQAHPIGNQICDDLESRVLGECGKIST